MFSKIDLDNLRRQASILPDSIHSHEEDCSGSLCIECGHCLHSIVICDHVCTPESGCYNAIDTDEIRFRRAVLALIEDVEQARAKSMEQARAGEPCQHRIEGVETVEWGVDYHNGPVVCSEGEIRARYRVAHWNKYCGDRPPATLMRRIVVTGEWTPVESESEGSNESRP